MERADAPRGGTQEGVRVGAEGGEGAGKTREQRKEGRGRRSVDQNSTYDTTPRGRDCFAIGEFSESQSRLLCSVLQTLKKNWGREGLLWSPE